MGAVYLGIEVPEIIIKNICREYQKWMKEHDGKMHRIVDLLIGMIGVLACD